MINEKNRAIFFDRDGVINETIDHGQLIDVAGKMVNHTAPFSYAQFKVFPGVKEAIAAMRELGFLVILATNQPDVVYGTLSRQDHERIMADVAKLPLDAIYVCEHGRDDGCNCKKPKPGMLLQAAQEHSIDLGQSYIIGDTENDIKAGQAVGAVTILINTPRNQDLIADIRVNNLTEAVDAIRLTF